MILTVIQARLGSTRLPGKILLPIAGKSILQHVYDAAPEPKVVAMPESDRLSDIPGCNIFWCALDENDVLSRFYHALFTCQPGADWVLRLTADCPMLTRPIVNRFLIRVGEKSWDTIYTNRPLDADGFDMELFSVAALEKAHREATDPYDREHVTPYIYRHFNVRRLSIFGGVVGDEDLVKVSVDIRDDYERVKKMMEGTCTSTL